MQQTTNYKLNQIERTDNIKESVDALGQNAVEIDRLLKEAENKVDKAEAILPTTTASGENVYIDNAVKYQLMSLKGEGKCEQVTTSGKQLFGNSVPSGTSNGVERIKDGDYYVISGTPTNTWANITSTKENDTVIKIPAGQYTVSLHDISNLNENHTIDYKFTYADGTVNTLSLNKANNYKSTYTFTQEMEGYLLISNMTIGEDLGTVKFKFQLEQGNTATPYEPYTGGQASPNPDYPQEITTVTEAEYKGVGKNLYNKDTDIIGKVYSNTGVLEDSALWTTSDWIPVESNTGYYIHSKTTNTQNFFTSEFDENKTFIQRTTGGKITTNANTKYIRFSYKNDLGMYDIQVELGTEATPYEPHQESTLPIDLQGNELCKVRDIADKLLIDRKGNVVIEKNIGKVVFNGSETWEYNSTYYYFRSPTFVWEQKIKNNAGISSTFRQATVWTTFRDSITENLMFITNDGYKICMRNLNITTVEEFVAWLSENPVTVYYQIATPQIIELGTIENPEIFKGVNNITVETNAGNMNVEIEYVEDLQARISKIEQAIVAQGGI